ncbi:transcriptional regulator, LacI family [Microlunatus sagamiharensis]|uniref:Transcriptional regulator, LacI family n=1 Tax=Microlunatus sagamiharensis TaxID=546874 RepID=A0A1H2N1V0_9ACTN|nr:LacI family DNA-binding transcriptional regulator [Microlunatus sagamiharensis]SDU99035.1 transcriptional regulator, LacI family [Microlunatus sagamiharensis]
MTRRATAQDVADLAGVSRSAVSLVLNGRADGNISRAKQEAVREAAEQLRYTPNAVALSLRSKRTGTIGVLTWPDRRHMPLALLGAVYTAASRAGYLLMMVDAVQRPTQVDALVDRRVDGFVVVAPELTAYPAPEAVTAVPTVLVNCFDDALAASSLVPDEVGAGLSAAHLLLDAGHRVLGVLAGREGLASERRVQGVTRATADAGLAPPVVVEAGHSVEDGYDGARRLLSSDLPPTALVCTHERLALGALLAAADLGLRVPDDLSLVSLDDGEDLASQLVPAVTRVERPDEVIATHALDLLVEQLRLGHPDVRRLTFVCPVHAGESVGPPRLRAMPTG